MGPAMGPDTGLDQAWHQAWHRAPKSACFGTVRSPWSSRLRPIWLYGPTILYCVLIFALSAQPALPSTPGGDKVAHLVAYSILGLLAVRSLFFSTRWAAWQVVLVSTVFGCLYGLSDEIHQSFVPGRDASGFDWLADATGAFLGSAAATSLCFMIWRDRRRFTSRLRP